MEINVGYKTYYTIYFQPNSPVYFLEMHTLGCIGQTLEEFSYIIGNFLKFPDFFGGQTIKLKRRHISCKIIFLEVSKSFTIHRPRTLTLVLYRYKVRFFYQSKPTIIYQQLFYIYQNVVNDHDLRFDGRMYIVQCHLSWYITIATL